MSWTEYKVPQQTQGKKFVPRVLLQGCGSIMLNGALVRQIGDFNYCTLWYDSEKGKVALKLYRILNAEAKPANSYRIARETRGQRKISCKHFVNRVLDITKCSMQCKARYIEAHRMIVIDYRNGVPVGERGKRLN